MHQHNECHAFCDCGGTFRYDETGQQAWHTCKYRDTSFGDYGRTSEYEKNVAPTGRVAWFRVWKHTPQDIIR